MSALDDILLKLCMKCLRQGAGYGHNGKYCYNCTNMCVGCSKQKGQYTCCNIELEYCYKCLNVHTNAHLGTLDCCRKKDSGNRYPYRTTCHYCRKMIHYMCRYSGKNELDMCQECAQIHSIGQITCSEYNYDLTHCKNELLSKSTIRCMDCNLPFCQSHVKICDDCSLLLCKNCSKEHLCRYCQSLNCTQTNLIVCEKCNKNVTHVKTIYIATVKYCQTKMIKHICCKCAYRYGNRVPSSHQYEHKFCHVCDIEHCADETDYCMNCSKKKYIHNVLLNNICYICHDNNQVPTIKTNLCCDCKTSNSLLVTQIGNHLPGDINLSRIVSKYMKTCLPIHEIPINRRHVINCTVCNQYVCKQHQNRYNKIIKCLYCFNKDSISF